MHQPPVFAHAGLLDDVQILTDNAAYMRSQGDVEIPTAKQRFEIPVDKAPKDVILVPNTWVLMDPPKFVKL